LLHECSNRGGRYWSVQVTRLGKEGGVVGICAPKACTADEVSIGITHRYLRTWEKVDFPRPFVPVPESDFTELKTATKNEAMLWSRVVPANFLSFLEVNKNLVAKLAGEAEAIYIDLNDAPEPVIEILPSPSLIEWLHVKLREVPLELRLLALGLPDAWQTRAGVMVFADADWLRSKSSIAKSLSFEDFHS